MYIEFKCTECGESVWRIYVSRNIIQCHNCLKEEKLNEVYSLTIEHQR